MNISNNDKLREIDIYFSELKRFKPLSRERETELARLIREGDQHAIDEMVKANLRFVVKIAKRYKSSGVPLHDLISEGNIGLIRAAKKFDETKGVKFISYAVFWVKSAIRECVDEHNRNSQYQGDEYMEKMTRDTETEYTANATNETFELDLVNNLSRRAAIDELMDNLNERERKILLMYFGIDRKSECTLEEIGEEMEITRERVRQIRDKALTKMKVNAMMSDEFDSFKETR